MLKPTPLLLELRFETVPKTSIFGYGLSAAGAGTQTLDNVKGPGVLPQGVEFAKPTFA